MCARQLGELMKHKLLRSAAVPVIALSALVGVALPASAGGLGGYTGSGVNIRTCASTGCSSNGQGQPSHSQCTNYFVSGHDIKWTAEYVKLTTDNALGDVSLIQVGITISM